MEKPQPSLPGSPRYHLGVVRYDKGMGITTLLDNLAITDELFTHTAIGAVNVTRALAYAQDHLTPVPVPVDQHMADYVRLSIGLDPDWTPTERRLSDPLLATLLPDGTTLLLDGHHRYLQMWSLRMAEAQAYILSSEETRNFRCYRFKQRGADAPVQLADFARLID